MTREKFVEEIIEKVSEGAVKTYSMLTGKTVEDIRKAAGYTKSRGEV